MTACDMDIIWNKMKAQRYIDTKVLRSLYRVFGSVEVHKERLVFYLTEDRSTFGVVVADGKDFYMTLNGMTWAYCGDEENFKSTYDKLIIRCTDIRH